MYVVVKVQRTFVKVFYIQLHLMLTVLLIEIMTINIFKNGNLGTENIEQRDYAKINMDQNGKQSKNKSPGS